MKKRCLPCYLIARNIVMLLVATAGLVLVSADLQTQASRSDSNALALRQMLVYQLLSRLEPE